MSLLLTDDKEIHALNRQWRDKDKPTDVLSWPSLPRVPPPVLRSFLTPADPLPGYAGGRGLDESLGDIAISLDTAARQASVRGWDLEDEVALLLVHGILHLLGHEDDTEAGSEAMKAIEREIIGKPLDPL